MIRSVVMFAHVVGVLALFGALAVESVGWASVRRSMARAEALPFFFPSTWQSSACTGSRLP